MVVLEIYPLLFMSFYSSSHALMFGLAAGASGFTILLTQVNGLTALLGVSYFLYCTV